MNDISSREIMRRSMRRIPTDRIPTMPQICHDTPIRLFSSDSGDWIERTARCMEDPSLIYEYVIRLVRKIDCDGLRLFVKPDPMKVRRKGDELIVVNRSGDRIGRIDLHGGGGFVADQPRPPVESLADVRARLAELEAAFTDEKLERLRSARSLVPDKFVASCPSGITMNTYSDLRGREQAMLDLLERPDFVRAVMDLQTETAIRLAEKLIPTGIDAFYIGDPAASASIISPRHFEAFCLAPYQKFCRHFKGRDMLIYLHICGNSNPILEMMADTGAHTVEPLDPLGGVSVRDAKRRIGGKVALMGGVNTLTLSRGTASEVREEAIQKCREGGPFGYILAAGDMVPPDTSMENLQALVDVSTRSLWKKSSKQHGIEG